MGGRYWISGVDVGMLIAYSNAGKTKEIEKLAKKISSENFIGEMKELYPDYEIVIRLKW